MAAGFLDARITEPRAAPFSFCEGCLCSLGDHLALVLGDGRENVNVSRLAVGMSQAIKSAPLSIRFAIKATLRASRSRRAMRRTARRFRHSASAAKLRPVDVPASAFDLGIFGDQLAAADMRANSLTLRVEAQAAGALAVGRNPVVGDEILRRLAMYKL